MTANSGPSPSPLAKASQTVTGFFSAMQAGDLAATRRFVAEDATTWNNGERITRLYRDTAPGLVRMREIFGPWTYSDARQVVSGDRVCEQHLVRFRPDGVTEFVLDVCVVLTLNATGLIVTLEEYGDAKQFAAMRAHVRATWSARETGGSGAVGD